jgi:flagellar motility protein MotE (MotC chaperone)
MSNTKAEKFRALAAKALAEAERATNPESRQELQDLAERYERLARWAEQTKN